MAGREKKRILRFGAPLAALLAVAGWGLSGGTDAHADVPGMQCWKQSFSPRIWVGSLEVEWCGSGTLFSSISGGMYPHCNSAGGVHCEVTRTAGLDADNHSYRRAVALWTGVQLPDTQITVTVYPDGRSMQE